MGDAWNASLNRKTTDKTSNECSQVLPELSKKLQFSNASKLLKGLKMLKKSSSKQASKDVSDRQSSIIREEASEDDTAGDIFSPVQPPIRNSHLFRIQTAVLNAYEDLPSSTSNKENVNVSSVTTNSIYESTSPQRQAVDSSFNEEISLPSRDTIHSAPETLQHDLISDEINHRPSNKNCRKRARSPSLMKNNFRRINMKKRCYSRGVMSDGAKKRKLWKAKMISRSLNRDNVCFNCHEFGHWAANCPTKSRNEGLDANFTISSQVPELHAQENEILNRLAEGIDISSRSRTYIKRDNVFHVNKKAFTPSVKGIDFDIEQAAKKIGFNTLRPFQLEAVRSILQQRSTLVAVSTGAGKSLCYQLAAYLLHKQCGGISIVISPLVALMDDQVASLPRGVSGACLHSGLTATQRKRVLKRLSENKLALLLVSPESITLASGRGMLPAELPSVSFICIDEAHCISEWSHNFRPSYLRLCRIISSTSASILALTATAAPAATKSMLDLLHIDNHIGGTGLPSCLMLTVSREPACEKERSLQRLLKTPAFSHNEAIVIYCSQRRICQQIAIVLNNSGLKCECYHAGMSATERRQVVKRLEAGETKIVAATIAFGMGVDLDNIANVIHYDMPSSVESYIQEVGRAGRKRSSYAYCHVFFSDDSELLHANRLWASHIEKRQLKLLLKKIYKVHNHGPICEGHLVSLDKDVHTEINIQPEVISTILCYLESMMFDCGPQKALEVVNELHSSICNVYFHKRLSDLPHILRSCIPLRNALILTLRKYPHYSFDGRKLSFPLINLCDHFNLEVKDVVNDLFQWQVNGIKVHLANPSTLLRIPCNLEFSQLDSLVHKLSSRINERRDLALSNIHYLSEMLLKCSTKNCLSLYEERNWSENTLELSMGIKSKLDQYLTNGLTSMKTTDFISNFDVNDIRDTVKEMLLIYDEADLNGRALTFILLGIDTPSHPAKIWCIQKQFWARFSNKIYFPTLLKLVNDLI